MQLVVDNTREATPSSPRASPTGLRAGGHDVELREPEPASMFDTIGASRLDRDRPARRRAPEPRGVGEISEVVRAALQSHPSLRRRSRAVPVKLGTGSQVLTWIDAFD